MARLSDRKTLSNEEIEASVEELSRKLEILRVRYEQYFIGVEKVAPSVMRMEVVRIMRDLEQLKIKNTAIKFKLRTVVQKFTSYSTYWNRTLREIEDGTYKRHVDKAKREAERLKSPRLFSIQTFVEGDFSFIYYELYARQFKVVLNRLALDARHHTHDCRKTFVTMAKRANVDEYAIKRIIGHQIADLTERLYTDRSIDWLRSEIEKIR